MVYLQVVALSTGVYKYEKEREVANWRKLNRMRYKTSEL